MLEIYRYHNPAKCDSNDTASCFKGPVDNPRNQKQLRRPCPIWVRGTDPSGKYLRQSLRKTIGYSTRDWNDAYRKIQEWENSGSEPQPVVESRRTVRSGCETCTSPMWPRKILPAKRFARFDSSSPN